MLACNFPAWSSSRILKNPAKRIIVFLHLKVFIVLLCYRVIRMTGLIQWEDFTISSRLLWDRNYLLMWKRKLWWSALSSPCNRTHESKQPHLPLFWNPSVTHSRMFYTKDILQNLCLFTLWCANSVRWVNHHPNLYILLFESHHVILSRISA